MAEYQPRPDLEKASGLSDSLETLPAKLKASLSWRCKSKTLTPPNAAQAAEKYARHVARQWLPILVPLRTQIYYWAVAATTVLIRHALHETIPHPKLIAPSLLTLGLGSSVILLFHWRYRREVRYICACIFILASTEAALCIRMMPTSDVPQLQDIIAIWSDATPAPPWPARQIPALRFCLAYCAISALDIERRGARRVVHDDGHGTTAWCLPWWIVMNNIGYDDGFIWPRCGKLRGALHTALAIFISAVLTTAVAYFLGSGVGIFNTLVLRGSNCLGNFDALWQMLLLQPIHDLTFWLSEWFLRSLPG